jgi:hypothetical protein
MMNQPDTDPAKPDVLLWVLLVAPLCLSAAKLPLLPTSPLLTNFLSLTDLPVHFHGVVKTVLIVTLGALTVVAFRLILGIQVLGLFRPILLAMAFEVIGVPMSTAFLVCALAIIVALRSLLRTDHNYARVAVLLSLVSALLLIPLIIGKWWASGWLMQLAFFPVIALCLTCESFAKVMDRQGVAEAVWRAVTTITVALVITAMTETAGTVALFLRFPELLLVQAACILLINKHLDFRLFEGMNPLRRRWRGAEGRLDTALDVKSEGLGD